MPEREVHVQESSTPNAIWLRARRRMVPLTTVDEEILAFLELADGEGLVFGGDIAAELGLQPKSIGPRLVSLRLRGYVESMIPANATRTHGWRLTQKGRDRA